MPRRGIQTKPEQTTAPENAAPQETAVAASAAEPDLTTEPLTAADAPQDPFADLGALRLSQDFAAQAGVERVLVTVPVRKPAKTEFYRAHPGAAYHLDAALIEDKEARESYLVMPGVRDQIPELWKGVRLYTAVTRAGAVFLLPVALPNPERREPWRDSLEECVRLAMDSWIRSQWSDALRAYEPFRAKGDLGEPRWPRESLNELLRIAFRGSIVDSLDHPVVRRLLGLE